MLLIFVFISTGFLAFSLKELGSPNSGFLHLYSSMDLKKIVLEKRKRTGLSSRALPSPPDNPEKFITREAEKLYHKSLFNRTFVVEHDIPGSNIYFTFMIQEWGWTTFYTHPPHGITPVVREFHSNLRFQLGTTIYVRGKWEDFSATVINWVYNLVDNDSDAYRALF